MRRRTIDHADSGPKRVGVARVLRERGLRRIRKRDGKVLKSAPVGPRHVADEHPFLPKFVRSADRQFGGIGSTVEEAVSVNSDARR